MTPPKSAQRCAPDPFRVFEVQVVGVYNAGFLNVRLLELLTVPFRGCPLGEPTPGLLTFDGQTVRQVVANLMEHKAYKRPRHLPTTPDEWDDRWRAANAAHDESLAEQFERLMNQLGWSYI